MPATGRLVDCPTGGVCGSARHYAGSTEYLRCTGGTTPVGVRGRVAALGRGLGTTRSLYRAAMLVKRVEARYEGETDEEYQRAVVGILARDAGFDPAEVDYEATGPARADRRRTVAHLVLRSGERVEARADDHVTDLRIRAEMTDAEQREFDELDVDVDGGTSRSDLDYERAEAERPTGGGLLGALRRLRR